MLFGANGIKCMSQKGLCRLLRFSHPRGLTEAGAGKNGVLRAQLFFNAQQLIVLGQAFGTAGGTGFDLSRAQAYRQVSNIGILCLTRTMRGHDTPTSFLGLDHGSDRFGNRANLVDFQQQTSAGLFLNRTSNLFNVGNS